MTPEKCPGCGTKLSPEMLACPNCPMSFPEDDGPAAGMSNPLKQNPYWQFLLPALFFGGLGAGIWYMSIGLLHLGEENSKTENIDPVNGHRSTETVTGTPPAGGPAGTTATPASGGGPSDAPASGESTAAAGDKPDAEPTATVISITPTESGPAKPRKVVKEWKLRGQVYDLTTLAPVAGAQLAFSDESVNRKIMTRTDSAGRYRVIVPPLDGRGYAVTIAKNGYAAAYLDPGTEGVRQMPKEKRDEMAKDLAATLAFTPAPVQGFSEDPLITDFYLAPRR